jgi:hypothetical protein
MLRIYFEENPALQPHFREIQLTPAQFFWTLRCFTTWESFYHLPKVGLLDDGTYSSYKNTLRLILATPKQSRFWTEFTKQGSYRTDWVRFVNALNSGETLPIPLLPWPRRAWRRSHPRSPNR